MGDLLGSPRVAPLFVFRSPEAPAIVTPALAGFGRCVHLSFLALVLAHGLLGLDGGKRAAFEEHCARDDRNRGPEVSSHFRAA